MDYSQYFWILVFIVLIIIIFFTLYFNNQQYHHNYDLLDLAKNIGQKDNLNKSKIKRIILKNVHSHGIYGQVGILMNDHIEWSRKIYHLKSGETIEYNEDSKLGRYHLQIANLLNKQEIYLRYSPIYTRLEEAQPETVFININKEIMFIEVDKEEQSNKVSYKIRVQG